MTDGKTTTSNPAKAKCPVCGKPRDADYRPFCSRRCADIDLGRWLSESYSMPMPDNEAAIDPDEQER
jgi:hypothetical protein